MAFGPMIFGFKGKYYFLSNYYSCPVTYQGITYQNSEAAFHAQKDPSRAREFCNLNPSQAKRLGRKVNLRSDWEFVKDNIMKDIIIFKFKQNPELAKKLIGTGDSVLVEANNWGDAYWGYDEVNNCGQNRLGYILMEVRDLLNDECRVKSPVDIQPPNDIHKIFYPSHPIFKLTYTFLIKDEEIVAYVEADSPDEVESRFHTSHEIMSMYPINVVSIEMVDASEVDPSKEYVKYNEYYADAMEIAKLIKADIDTKHNE